MVDGIDWAIEKKVNIINFSFGTSYDSAAMHKAIKRAKKAGILMFASAGNLGNGRKVEYPAAYKEVVAVGASSVDGNLSEMTNDGDGLELLAPGEAIKSTGWLDMECISNGTSFSVPHAVGVASLLWQKDTTKSAEFIRNLMKTSAKHIENNGRDYLLIDYEYACKIYDDYNEQYSEKDYFVEFEDEFQNNSEVEDYSGEVEGRWSIEDHKETVDNCYERINSDFEDAAIVKIGVAAPDRFCSYAIHPSHQMFHAISNDRDHNYVRVCEYIMNMATYCKKYGHAATLSANCKPDNANDSDYNTVKSWLGPAEIDFMLKNSANGVYAYNDKNAALVMLGIAMHVMGDTYSHQSREKINGKYEKLKKEKRDIKEKIPQRYSCAKESMLNLWTNYYNNIKTNGTDFEVVGTKFRLNKLYTYSINSTNGKSKSWSSFKDLKRISCND